MKKRLATGISRAEWHPYKPALGTINTMALWALNKTKANKRQDHNIIIMKKT